MKLEELFKEKWIETGNSANGCIILAKDYERIIYDPKTEEISNRYSILPEKKK